MSKLFQTRLLSIGVGALTLALFTAPSTLAQGTPERSDQLAEQLTSGLGLSGGAIGGVEILESFDQNLLIGFEHPSESLFLELAPHSVRSAAYQVLVQQADGSYQTAAPEPSNTYRGTVLGEEGSRVAASYTGTGLHARIQLENGTEYWIEPAGAGYHALYQTEQVIDSGKTCGSDHIEQFMIPSQGSGNGTVGGSTHGGNYNMGLTTAEVACDTDYEYFQDYGSVSGVTNRIESVINTMNLQYERDVAITHAISAIIVRSSSNDPYGKKPADQLLFEFRAEWNANNGNIQRDVAHLFTGRTLAGSTIGIAWLSQVCNLDYAYGLVQSDFNGSFASATDLSAHELGHNWGAGHCSCTTYTMNAYITSSNRFNPSGTVPSITAYRDSQSCFGTVEPPADPVSIHVGSIAVGTQNAGQGKKRGSATVSIVTDTGGAEAGASVTGTFSGTYSESVAGTTDAAGNVSFTTSATAKGGVSVTFCVDSVSGSLPYVSGDNVEDCDNF